MKHLHLPLPESLHAALLAEASRSGQPATTLAREALQGWLQARQQAALNAELDAYIAAEAGGPHDLDDALEAARVDLLLAHPEGTFATR